MRLPLLNTRHRILGACMAISVAAAAGMGILGLGLRRVLRLRARQSCVRMASLFEGVVHDRLVDLVAETGAVADAIRWSDGPLAEALSDALPLAGATTRVCSWAVYEPAGRLLARRRDPSTAERLERLGIGAERLPRRERARVAAAAAGRNGTVLVPAGGGTYALHYMRLDRPSEAPLVLQAATAADGSILSSSFDATGAHMGLRPFDAAADGARLIHIHGEPHLLVYRPLMCGGRRLGTVTVALPYGDALRCERMVALGILGVVVLSVLIFLLASRRLTGLAMAPIQRTTDLLRQAQEGALVELCTDVPDDETGALIETCQRSFKQSQEWADRLMASDRAFRELFTGAAEALVGTIEAKDQYTAGHAQRVAHIACRLAERLGWDAAAVEELRVGAMLHDIGKIGIGGAILNKPGRLTDAEMDAIRQHPAIGARILSTMPDCERILHVVRHHHERYDGTGYPAGLAGHDIPIGARIAAIADVYDALTSKRSYRDAHPKDEAVAILMANRGRMFDPELLDLFVATIVDGLDARVMLVGDETAELAAVLVDANHQPSLHLHATGGNSA